MRMLITRAAVLLCQPFTHLTNHPASLIPYTAPHHLDPLKTQHLPLTTALSTPSALPTSPTLLPTTLTPFISLAPQNLSAPPTSPTSSLPP